MVVAVSLGVGSLALATGRGAEAFDGAILFQTNPERSECPDDGEFDATILQEFKYLCEAFHYLSQYSHEYSAGDLASLGSAAADAVEEAFVDGRLNAHGTDSRPHKCVLPFSGFADACTQIERAVADDTVDAILLAGDAMMKEYSLHRLLTPAQRDTWRQGQKGDRPQWFGLEVLPLDANDAKCWPLSEQEPKCQLKITHVHSEGPAWDESLRAGQVIEEWSVVDGRSLSDLDECDVYEQLGLLGRYPSDTEVIVQVLGLPGIDISVPVRFSVATVPWAWSQMVDAGGYLRMEWTPFVNDPHSSGSIDVFRDALSELAGVSAVVLDMRDTNQRGILKRHLDAIGYFLPANSALLTRSHTKELVPYGGGTPEGEHIPMRSTVTPVDTTTPVRVVVSPVPTDRSGRFDMIPAVLQHADRADIVGTGTVGTPIRVNDKFVVEQYIPIGEGRGWRMFYAREEWRLPNDTVPPAYTLDHNIDLPTCASLNDITAAALGEPILPPTTTTVRPTTTTVRPTTTTVRPTTTTVRPTTTTPPRPPPPGPPGPPDPDPTGTPFDYFVDDEGSVHEDNINRIAAARITLGCSAPTDNPPWGDRYCPDEPVPRSQMASLLARALDLPAADQDYFVDDEGSVHEDNINRIAAARITVGCNPPSRDRYCPDEPVARSQMASLLARALDLPAADQDYFVDDEGSVHEDNINRVATVRITVGCNPPSRDRYCPDEPVARSQMASLLARALNLS